ncbi:MAG: glycosyltransferase family 4 protein [Candidatus Omnitrophica bacterium]|nr:glycosyltransferase family 4 protein [Candidatus Omnitrophota bacterium]
MKICMVAWHGCIRVFKETIALQAAGHIVYLIGNRIPWGFNAFDQAMIYADKGQMQRSIASCDADIFHVHNEPDWLVSATRDATKKPIIFDVHDLESLRWGEGPNQEEYDAFKAADGYIHVSEPCKMSAEIYHGADKPTRIIYSYVNERFLAPDNEIVSDPSYESMVYEGGLDAKETPKPINEKPNQFKVNIRYMAGLFNHIHKQGISVNCISASPIDNDLYEQNGCFVSPSVSYPSMLMGLRPYGFGFVGSPWSSPLMEYAMPNKLFEYISQGVVPVCLFASESARFCKKYDMGTNLDPAKMGNFKDMIADVPRQRLNLLKHRHEFIMENQTSDIISLYEEVLK